ncbi:MAG: hypothetical protein FJX76_06095 [Armatimonadetes bacterium]|nr:hypothetical protein [Armatimonadota bacterium]
MAELRRKHLLHGMSRRVGAHLELDQHSDGSARLRAANPDGRLEAAHWETFREAVAYALAKKTDPTYKAVAAERHTSPFRVATADFLHVPEIDEIDVRDYHGHAGDEIRVRAHDDVKVTEVGIIVLDEENRPIEIGQAVDMGPQWVYKARRQATSDHVRIIVDAADIPGNLSEARVEKTL